MQPSVVTTPWVTQFSNIQAYLPHTGSTQIARRIIKAATFPSDISPISEEKNKSTWGSDIGTAAVTTDLTQKVDRIVAIYTMRDILGIRTYIRAHQTLADMLIEAYDQIARFFGPVPQIVLSIDGDPAGEDSELFGSILTPLDVPEALNNLNEFDQSWFLDQISRTEGKLNFNVTFL